MASLTISRWGLDSVCAIGRYNEQPMVTLWNTLFQFRNIDCMGERPLLEIIRMMERDGSRDDFLLWSGTYNPKEAYAATLENVLHNWNALIIMIVAFALGAMIALEFIDRDKR